jgi:hypothetical protein
MENRYGWSSTAAEKDSAAPVQVTAGGRTCTLPALWVDVCIGEHSIGKITHRR